MQHQDRPHYKHYIGITSQIGFCQVPLRLDAFNQCSFSCSYCFAKARGGYRGDRTIQIARAQNLEERFRRIQGGLISSAVDEFLSRRIPIQFGGMTDPFSSFEQKTGATRNLLEILTARNYPTLISTKSATLADPGYSRLLAAGNYLVRFSISVVREAERINIEKGTPSPTELFHTIRMLSDRGIKCAVRFQPIIPGHEQCAFDLIRKANHAGAKHITLEYLKLPTDDLKSPICMLESSNGERLIDHYRRCGATQQGRELVLPRESRIGFLSEASKLARKQGLSVGFGDNEFLPYSDGQSCCSGADLYLTDINLFESNPASLIRRKKKHELIGCGEFSDRWIPSSNINTYLNSHVRPLSKAGEASWISYLREHWRVGAIYAPDFFHGVEFAGSEDDTGMPNFVKNPSRFLAL